MSSPVVRAERRRAVVVGAGLSGLLATGALAGHFLEVVVVERAPMPGPRFPGTEAPSPGDCEPWSAEGCTALARLFPGVCAPLCASGLPQALSAHTDALAAVSAPRPCVPEAQTPRINQGMLEQRLRAALFAMPNVRFMWHTRACGLRIDEEAHRVTSVRIRGAAELPRTHWLRCDLLVDAGGRFGVAARWLVEDGLPAPPRSRIGSGVPSQSAGMRRHYERLGRPVRGLLALGDSLCTFNPVHGYGPALAAQQAVALSDCLAERPGDPARRYQRKVAALLNPVWRVAATLDLAQPGARPREGAALHLLRPLGWWLARTARAARHDPQLASEYDAVLRLRAPLRRLFSIAMIVRVLRGPPMRPGSSNTQRRACSRCDQP